jgi:predicted P-loop ATPase
MEILKEAERLHKLGFAVHWLRPRSKAPVEARWTTGPREDWRVLKTKYRPGLNLGVRLGSPSQLGQRYLGAIDFDLKSVLPRHRSEMLGRVEEEFPHLLAQAPQAASGRRNGSGHLYVLTPSPLKPLRIAQSNETVKVKMPSVVKLSGREKRDLTESEIKAGFRLRPAWEISLMGEGQQIALPPSLHPDTGQHYVWERELPSSGSRIPLLDRVVKESMVQTPYRGLFTDVDLTRFNLGDELLSMLHEGEDWEGNADQSALAFKLAIALVRAGASDEEIVSVLTDNERYELASVGYRHRHTQLRERAADWVKLYCVKKAREEHDSSRDFDRNVQVSDAELKLIEESKVDGDEWKRGLDRNAQTEKPLSSVKNICLILQNAVAPSVFKLNEFAAQMVYGADAPWNGKRAGDPVTDIDPINVMVWLSQRWRFEPAKNKVADAIEEIAGRNRFHPVREYLNSLEWDGEPRLDRWLATYLGAKAKEPYLSAVSRKVLCAMVARVFRPGIKFDHVLVLEGKQGVGKSSVVNILGGKWTLDATLNLRDKDSVQSLFGRWIVELGELTGIKHADLETMKAFISRGTDHIRVSYGRWAQDYPRQCIFVGTTNEEQYLKDSTGERRFWPVRTRSTLYDMEGLRRDRDQLFAEAVFAWRTCGEQLFLTNGENDVAIAEQGSRAVEEPWLEKVAAVLERERSDSGGEEGSTWARFTTTDILDAIRVSNPSYADTRRVTSVLRQLGYESKPRWVGERQVKLWVARSQLEKTGNNEDR